MNDATKDADWALSSTFTFLQIDTGPVVIIARDGVITEGGMEIDRLPSGDYFSADAAVSAWLAHLAKRITKLESAS